MTVNPQNTSPPPASHRGILWVLFLGVLMAALDIAIVGPALPALRAHFGIDERTVAWVITTFVLFNLVGVPVMAKLADLFGRRTVYAVDVSLFALGALVVAFAPSLWVLLAGRMLQGLGASGIFPVASAVVGDTFEPQKRGRILGVLGAVFGLAFIVGPILAGVLLQYSWSWLFLLNLPLALVVLVGGLRVLPALRPAGRYRFDWQGALVLALMLFALAYGLNHIDADRLWASLVAWQTWLPLLLAGALLSVFITVERRAGEPVVRLQLFANRQVRLVGLLAFGAGLSEASVVFFPELAVAAFGVDNSTASFMLVPVMVSVAVGSPLAGHMVDHLGSKTVVVVCAALVAVGMALVGLFGTSRLFFYAGSVPIGVGLAGLLGSSLNYILLREVEVTERTIGQGIITVSLNIGLLTGSAFIGALAASGGGSLAGYRSALLVVGGVALLLALVASRLKGRVEEREQVMMDVNG
jgi:MFS family permease